MLDVPRKCLEDLVTLVTDKIGIKKDPSLPYVGLEHIPSEGSRVLAVAPSADSISTNTVFRCGDTLLGKLRPRLRKVLRVSFDGYCSTDILALRAKAPAHPGFASFILRSDAVFAQAIRTEEGTKMPRCSWQALKTVEVFCPDSAEQAAIAEVLSILDEAIEATTALIAKMRQVKAGMMHDLFTCGVTPDGCLRPVRADAPELYKETSIGWIPQEWDLQPLGRLSEIISGVTLGTSHIGRDAVTVPYLRVANVQDGYVDLTNVKTITVPPHQLQRLRLKRGDVLMNEGGDYDKLGRGCVWDGAIDPCIHQNHVFRVRPDTESLQSRYLAYWSQSEFGRRYFIVSSKQSTNLASINSTQLHRFPIAVPSRREQVQIERILDSVSQQCDVLNDELGKLGDVKRGLMHDLLTGRVRVCAD